MVQHDGENVILSETKDLGCCKMFRFAQHDEENVILSATKVSLLRFFNRYAPSEWRMFSMVQYDGESVILSETKDLSCYMMFRFAQHDE